MTWGYHYFWKHPYVDGAWKELGYLKSLRKSGSFGAVFVSQQIHEMPAEAMDHKSEGASGVAFGGKNAGCCGPVVFGWARVFYVRFWEE